MSSIPGVTSVGVVGAGLMGTGIAQVCLQAGYDVVVFDSNPEAVLRADARIKKVLGDGFAGGSLVLANFMGELADCELIIEAVFERRDVKQAALKELGQIAPNSILASNTSTLSITDLASVTPDPRKVAGAHFFSPVPKMKALEVVRALTTSDETIALLIAFGASIGKDTFVAPDQAGFLINRTLIPFMINCINEWVALRGSMTMEQFDQAYKNALGHPMGPLTLADLVGLDVLTDAADSMWQQTRRPDHVCPEIIRQMVASGWLGRKSKKGFYTYPAKS